ncbi:hypothetical protein DSM112329_00425 [Paraconexibacter sp. AEG42_29]|uniref:Carboxypeptidase regulatory-like domain-containing protein n=1 Tax=Paraconexibacter sp. AEG42_29 TaxID=2997339 RepID=A0AAU7AQ30_9ACTN
MRAALPVAILAALAGFASPAAAAAPAPCGGIPQITDPSKDGHHPNTDVLSAWFSEEAGRLQAVVKTFGAGHTAEHTDAELNVAAYAVLFEVAGRTRFVRASLPTGAPGFQYDYGTYTAPSTFTVEGTTTGSEIGGPGGTLTIDVPAQTGATPGVTLARPFVLTYDGVSGGVPDWVDHAPGGVSPTDPSVGADYVVGSCAPLVPVPGGDPVPGPGSTPVPAVRTSAVALTAPARLTGGGLAKLTGRVVPARGGVPVDVTVTGGRKLVRRVSTAADGSFAVTVPLKQTSKVRAVAEGIGSQTATVTVRSTVRIAIKRLPGGIVTVRGTVRPALPGKALLLRTTSSIPTATTRVSAAGTFSFRVKRPRTGRYQAVYIPSSGRAERSVSNTGVIR